LFFRFAFLPPFLNIFPILQPNRGVSGWRFPPCHAWQDANLFPLRRLPHGVAIPLYAGLGGLFYCQQLSISNQIFDFLD
jgi:hypothetical protein